MQLSDWGPDVIEMRNYIYSLINFDNEGSVLDAGCGKGYDLIQFKQRCDDKTNLIGIDSSLCSIKKAITLTKENSVFHFCYHDISSGLPFIENSIDVIYSANVFECIRDKEYLIAEMHRVLKPGGQIILCHYDWDTQRINGTDKLLIRKILHAFCDWTQDWMPISDGWMGRRILSLFHHHTGFIGKIIPYVLINTEFTNNFYGYQRIMVLGRWFTEV